MKKLFTYIVILCACLSATFVILLSIMTVPKADDYMLAYQAKIKRLETTPSPRLIFLGGSNLAFGLDSRRIQDSLHIPVINAALHAGIGLKYMIDDIDGFLQKGDILVIAPEYSHFFGKGAYGGTEALPPLMFVNQWRNIDKLNFHQWGTVLGGIPSLVRSNIFPSSSNERTYKASNFNEWGDETKHWTLSSKKNQAMEIKDSFNPAFANYFIDWLNSISCKCTIVITPPVCMESHYKLNMDKANEIADFLTTHHYPFNVSLATHALPDSCSYDTPYHMAKSGVDIFTSSLIKELRTIVRQVPSRLCRRTAREAETSTDLPFF